MARQYISFTREIRESYKGLDIFTDQGVHTAVMDEVSKRLYTTASILELGAGAGAFTQRLVDNGYHNLSATDIDDTLFKVEGVDFRKVSPDTSISEAFNGKKFKAVIAVEVIEHFRSTWQFLSDAAEALDSDGMLIVSTPNISSFYSRLVFLKEGRFFHFQGPKSWDMGHINPVPYFVIEQMADDLGMTVVDRQPVGRMPILDWSAFKISLLLTMWPRLILNLMMKGPGPKEGNVLLYTFVKK